MPTKKEGLISRLLSRAGLGKTTHGGGVTQTCWSCSMGKCGKQFDRTCACCRAGHGS